MTTIGRPSTRMLLGADATLRRLFLVTVVDSVGRGMFLTPSALYLTGVAGIPVGVVGLGLTAAGAAGVVSSSCFGQLSDRWSARRLLIALHLAQGTAVAAYVVVSGAGTFIVAAAVVSIAQQGNSAVRSGAVGRAFPGESRVRARATIRSGTNVGIAIGTSFAAVPLAIGGAAPFRVAFASGAAMLILSAALLTRVDPNRVDTRPIPGAGSLGDVMTETSPWRDRRFLLVTALTGLFGMQFGVFEVAVPLWVGHHTAAPRPMVSLLLLINTGLSILLQVRVSRGTDNVRGASRAMLLAGSAMAGACCLWALGGLVSSGAVVMVLIAAAVAHTIAELTSSAAGWAFSFELAPAGRVGAYQGVFGTGNALGAMAAPAVATWTAVEHGAPGWCLLGVVFLAAAVGTVLAVRNLK